MKLRTLLFASVLVAAVSCGGRDGVSGTYAGRIPAADCPGINVAVSLSADGRYSMTYDYEERETGFAESGTYRICGDTVRLSPDAGEGFAALFLHDGESLRMLDSTGNAVCGSTADLYILKKQN